MKLEEFKEEWVKVGAEAKPTLTPQKIRQMMHANYRRRLWRVILPEVFFAAVYLYFVVLILAFFDLLDTDFLAGLGGAMVCLLLAVPLLRLYLLRKLYGMPGDGALFGQELKRFAKYKLRYLTLRRAQAGLGFLFLVAICVLTARIYNEQAITGDKYFWAVLFSLGFLGVQVLNYLLLRRSRREITRAQEILQDIHFKND